MEIRGGKNKGGVRRDTKGQGRGLMFCVSSFIKWFNLLNNVDMTFKILNVNLNYKKKTEFKKGRNDNKWIPIAWIVKIFNLNMYLL